MAIVDEVLEASSCRSTELLGEVGVGMGVEVEVKVEVEVHNLRRT